MDDASEEDIYVYVFKSIIIGDTKINRNEMYDSIARMLWMMDDADKEDIYMCLINQRHNKQKGNV
jgi:hypothetical protein